MRFVFINEQGKRQKKDWPSARKADPQPHFEFAYSFLFLSYLELKRQIRSCTPVFLRKPYLIPDQNGQSLYPFEDQTE